MLSFWCLFDSTETGFAILGPFFWRGRFKHHLEKGAIRPCESPGKEEPAVVGYTRAACQCELVNVDNEQVDGCSQKFFPMTLSMFLMEKTSSSERPFLLFFHQFWSNLLSISSSDGSSSSQLIKTPHVWQIWDGLRSRNATGISEPGGLGALAKRLTFFKTTWLRS